ncbi:hypothetical protein SAMCFNEI73_pC1996 (plasmid) [Sinorhizobium americanum]|uniref:Uncharacterized protein n=1 Tax=Sinorhizobium americanum TaxID=194963 RepID=A0A1L3M022_9HYPH|nr:hypothetical protein SAMCFNEI73_pC1996 [Sinorhizobium americanum]
MRFHCLRFSLLNSPRRGGWRSSLATSTASPHADVFAALFQCAGGFGPRAIPFWSRIPPHPACRPPSPRKRGEGDSRRRFKSPFPACGERASPRVKPWRGQSQKARGVTAVTILQVHST